MPTYVCGLDFIQIDLDHNQVWCVDPNQSGSRFGVSTLLCCLPTGCALSIIRLVFDIISL